MYSPCVVDVVVPIYSYQEAFHLATMGGAEVLGLQKVVGNFLPGKQVPYHTIPMFAGWLIDTRVS